MVIVVAVMIGVAGVGVASEGFEVILEGYHISDFAFEGNIIWCVTDNSGILEYNITNEEIKQYTVDDGLLGNRYRCVSVGVDGVKWFGTGNGISSFDGEEWNHYNRKDNPLWAHINDVKIDIENIKWFAADHGIIKLKGSEWKHLSYLTGESIFIDHHNTKWFAGGGEGAIYDGQEIVEIYNESKDGFFYHRVAVDKNDVQFWSGDGLKFIDGDNVTSFGISGTAFALDVNNTMWIGSTARLWKYENGEISLAVYLHDYGLYYHVRDIEIDSDGAIWIVSSGILAKYTPDRTPTAVQSTEPETLSIIESYPNPFNAQTTLTFELPSESMATLAVYDITGRKVRELLAGDMQAGRHSVLWDGTDGDGVSVGSGLYFSRLSAGGEVATGRMLFVK